MNFGKVLETAWADYKLNIRSFSATALAFIIIPLLLVAAISYSLQGPLGVNDELKELRDLQGQQRELTKQLFSSQFSGDISEEQTISLNQTYNNYNVRSGELNLALLPYYGIIAFLILLASIFSLYGGAGLLGAVLAKKKFLFKDVIFFGKKLFWKYVGLLACLTLIFGVVLIGGIAIISLLFITFSSNNIALVLIAFLAIAGLLAFSLHLFIKLEFSTFVIAEGKTGVFDSLRESSNIVKGHWWPVFGYSLLIYFIIIAIPVAIVLILSVILLLITHGAGAEIIQGIFQIVYAFVLMPLFLLIFREIYLSFK